jgi:hypothetical protein
VLCSTALAAALVGCDALFGIERGDLAGGPSLAAAEAGPDGEAGVAGVGGTQVHHHVTDLGTVDVAVDFSVTPIAAIVLDGGGVDVYPGSGAPDGTFAIPGVPDGALYSVKIATPGAAAPVAYVFSRARWLTLDDWQLGRPDATADLTSLQVELDLSNLAPWQATDDLVLGSSNAGFVLGDTAMLWTNGPQAGGTSGSLQLDDHSALLGVRRVDPARGDAVFFLQRSTLDPGPGGASVSAASRYLEDPAIAIAGGVAAVYPVRLPGGAGAAETHAIRWDRGALARQRSSLDPHAKLGALEIAVSVLPGSHGSYFPSPPALWRADLDTYDDGVDPLSMTYANPFPPSWGQLGSIGLSLIATRATAQPDGGRATAVTERPFLRCSWELATFTGTPVPLVTPLRAPLIGGADAFVAHTGIGTSPVLEWSRPEVGTPTQYRVTVAELTSASKGAPVPVAALFTTETQLTIPPGVLESGHAYVFRFGTLLESGPGMEARPLLHAFPECVSEAVSEVQRP